MEQKTRQEAISYINDLCEQSGCNEKISKLHQAQYVDRSWHPHPPAKFVSWLGQHKNFVDDSVDVVRAYNSRHFREEFTQGNGERYNLPPGEGKRLSREQIRELFRSMVESLGRKFTMKIPVSIPDESFRDPLVGN